MRRAEELANPGAVLATGTSGIMISELSGQLQDPGRLVGTHWFYPANVMPLVEVARSEITDDDAVEQTIALLRLIGNKPVVVKGDQKVAVAAILNIGPRRLSEPSSSGATRSGPNGSVDLSMSSASPAQP